MRVGTGQDGERTLVEKFLRGGDESAFLALYRRQTPLLFRVAHRMVGDPDRAADIVQDTWLRAARGLASFRWQSTLSTWLVGIAVNRSREELRGREEGVAPAQDARSDRQPTDPSWRVDLDRALAQLSEGYRVVLMLHDVEGFTHEEIAQALGIEAATSRSQLTRAREAMRELLTRKGKVS